MTWTPLDLTSPYMGQVHPNIRQDIKDAQYLLQGHNRFHQVFLDPKAKRDGIYGPKTANATKQAKHFLGFPKAEVNKHFGDDLYSYLIPKEAKGRKLLPVLYQVRKKRRAKNDAVHITTRAGALSTAITQIGTMESPFGSNRVKYSEWYGIIGPWCGMFVSWCYAQHGSRFRYAYVPYVVEDARNNANGLQAISDPVPGDVTTYDWGTGIPQHMGIFEKWITDGNEFYAIEGNTSNSNNSNGGEVLRQVRTVSEVVVFVRVHD